MQKYSLPLCLAVGGMYSMSVLSYIMDDAHTFNVNKNNKYYEDQIIKLKLENMELKEKLKKTQTMN